jgi:hypothetical protein
MFLWIKKEATENEVTEWLKANGLENSLQRGGEGLRYVKFLADLFDPTRLIPPVSHEVVEGVTEKSRIQNPRAFRREGLYEDDGVSALIEMEASEGVLRQVISVRAPTIDKLRAFFLKLREGKIAPVSDWEAPQVVTGAEA